MLRLLSLVLLVSPAMALAQASLTPPAPPTPPMTQAAPPADVAPPAEPVLPAEAEAAPEEPKMKRVCHQEDVVGSAFPRMVCKMKPIKPPKTVS